MFKGYSTALFSVPQDCLPHDERHARGKGRSGKDLSEKKGRSEDLNHMTSRW